MTAAPVQNAAGRGLGGAAAQLASISRPARARLKHAPWPALALLAALIIPSDLGVNLGGLRLTPYRVLLLLLFVPAAVRMASGRAGRIIAADVLLSVFALWAWLAVIVHHGMAEGIEKGGIFTLETLGGYLVMRAWVTDVRRFRATVKALVIAVIVTILWTLPEALTGRHFVKSAFASATGSGFSGIGSRLGITRAFGSFDHPILSGVFCASVLGMAYYGLARREVARGPDYVRGALVIVAAFTSMSSGAVATVMVQLGLIVYERMTKLAGLVRGRWWMLIAAMAVNYVAVDALSNRSGIRVFLSYLTFSPGTAYDRLLIWEYGTKNVAANPVFGIGFAEWERPDWMHGSMDNFWLVNAVRYGLPAALCLIASVLILLRRAGRGIRPDALPAHRLARRGWIVSLIAVCIAGCTVHFWNAVGVHFFVLLGMGACLGWDAKEGRYVRQLRASAERELAGGGSDG